ncbi:LysR family transcriptional regulator [Neptuniibacter halophilus]|uniref:LysR family transcriptional regulator n=1 Tax=Neptuniibacter halophilus TaxID=651666 RepID=UPI00257485B4|nr:LysR family transcriptional regulator [Neptuniibacter halophilus]
MNPNLLKQLAIVVKQGSLSAACEQLHVTQPTLTRSIKQLEMRVGAPVLIRTRYGVSPTEIGARLSRIGERILAETEQGQEAIRQFHSGVKTEFVIGVDPLWEFATFRELSDYFLREKQYVFHFRTGSAAAQIDLVNKGELDFLLAPAHLSVAHGKLDRQVLFRDRSAVFAGKQSDLTGSGRVFSRDELNRQSWMTAGASAGFLEDEEAPAGVAAARVAFTGSIRSVLHLLQTSDMLVRLPARLALMTGEVEQEQMLAVEGERHTRRDIALWSSPDNAERPDLGKVRQLLLNFTEALDHQAPEFGLAL